MACSLNNTGFSVSGSNDTIHCCKGSLGLFYPPGNLHFPYSRSKEFMGKTLDMLDQRGFSNWNFKSPRHTPIKAQASSLCVSRALRWWEKNPTPNMIEIKSAQELVDTLLNAGDQLVILDFYAPYCGGCKALHPKICQIAEENPNAIFLKVNIEELRTMCQCLGVHIMPLFRFYRGSLGKVANFSCTPATVKKFKDALAKYGADDDKFGVGPAKGLDEKDLLALASAKLISIDDNGDDEEELLALASFPGGSGQISTTMPLPLEHIKTSDGLGGGMSMMAKALSNKDENMAALAL